jgi:hypothetical protein
MAVSVNYGQMQQQIAFEVGQRTDLLSVPSGFGTALSPIQQAIQNAIAKWERKRFYFNELNAINAFNTVAGQEYYTSNDYVNIGTIAHIDKIWALVSNNRYFFEPRTMQYLDEVSVNPNVAAPSVGADYAYFAETLRFYPIPDGSYPISIQGTKRFNPLVQTTDTNVWTQDAEALIRTEAKLDLYLNVIKDEAQAALMKVQIYGDPGDSATVGYLAALEGETFTRMAVPKVRGTFF